MHDETSNHSVYNVSSQTEHFLVSRDRTVIDLAFLFWQISKSELDGTMQQTVIPALSTVGLNRIYGFTVFVLHRQNRASRLISKDALPITKYFSLPDNETNRNTSCSCLFAALYSLFKRGS
jgi:hypothetical protein